MRSNRLKKLCLFATFASLFSLPSGAASADDPQDILIIVNKSVTQKSITPAELKNFFLKEKTTWSSGDQVVPIHAPSGSTLRRDFVKRVLGMEVEDEKIFWQERRIRTGKTRPVEFGNTSKAVFKLRGSIGYLYRSQYVEGVAKIIMVLPAQGGSSK